MDKKLQARSLRTQYCGRLHLKIFAWFVLLLLLAGTKTDADLPKVRVNGRSFETGEGKLFVPFGVNYYRPGTGWAPQVWKKFDASATRHDFEQMKGYGVNCVRVFLTYSSFCPEVGKLDPDGLAKFDQFLAIAEQAGIYVHPTGPDHWEGTPAWTQEDRIADERVVNGLVAFWKAFAARYRGRNVIFAYDLRNEPEVAWDNSVMRRRWAAWAKLKYPEPAAMKAVWNVERLNPLPLPSITNERRQALLLDYQHFREELADEWTRKQSEAIRANDPDALVTVGLIQWSVPTCLPRVAHYAAFNPARQARWLDFMEVHFYPLAQGAYEYRSEAEELQNLSYLHSVVTAVASVRKPVVLAEFGWYGGGKPTFDQAKHPEATEEQQARWCQRAIETTAGIACGWLNWGFYDQPEATDASQLTGLLKANGAAKAWGRTFKRMSQEVPSLVRQQPTTTGRPELDWDKCVVSPEAATAFRQDYETWFRNQRSTSR